MASQGSSSSSSSQLRRSARTAPTIAPPPPPEPVAVAASSTAQTRSNKRSRDQLEPQEAADVSSPVQLPAQRTLKRSRTAQSVAHLQPDDNHPASSASSSTLAPSQETRLVEESTTAQLESITTRQPKEERPALDDETLSTAEQHRLIKGKGKATATPVPAPSASPDKPTSSSETTRLEKELAFKNSLITSQLALLKNLRNTLVCNVCLEVLDMPFALACGHVFCRPCLYNWFHRPDPNAEDGPPPEDDFDDEASMLGSEEDSEEEIEGTSIIADDEEVELEEEEEEDNGGSYMGGTFFGRDFAITGGNRNDNWNQGMAAFNAIVGSVASRMTNSAAGRGVGAGGGAARGGAITDGRPAASGSSRTGSQERATAPRGAAMEAMRAARLSRFGAEGSVQASTSNTDNSAPQIVELSSDDEDDAPVAIASSSRTRPTSTTANTTRNNNINTNRNPSPHARSPRPNPHPAPPPPPPAPAPAPIGAHRTKNLICPQCRDPVHLCPSKIFVLTESIALIRQAEKEGLLSSLGGSAGPPSETEHEHDGGEEEGRLKGGRDESDSSWGGLWKEESREERRKRLAGVMRDREDGVRRCGECNWELDEETGDCNGCGRHWDLSDADSLIGNEEHYDALGDGFLTLNRYGASHLSEDEEPDSQDEAFIDDRPETPAQRRRNLRRGWREPTPEGFEEEMRAELEGLSEDNMLESGGRRGRGWRRRERRISSPEVDEEEEDDFIDNDRPLRRYGAIAAEERDSTDYDSEEDVGVQRARRRRKAEEREREIQRTRRRRDSSIVIEGDSEEEESGGESGGSSEEEVQRRLERGSKRTTSINGGNRSKNNAIVLSSDEVDESSIRGRDDEQGSASGSGSEGEGSASGKEEDQHSGEEEEEQGSDKPTAWRRGSASGSRVAAPLVRTRRAKKIIREESEEEE